MADRSMEGGSAERSALENLPDDYLQRFLFEDRAVRGAVLRIRRGWSTLQSQRDYPQPIRDLLGRAFAAAGLMASSIKFEGRMNLQLQGAGPVSLLLVQVDHNLHMRGVVQHADDGVGRSFRELTGDARLALMIDPASGRDRYQALVELKGETLAESLGHYFSVSEQLPTRFWLAASEDAVCGLMLQRMPASDDDEEAVEADWQRALELAAPLDERQLLNATGAEVVRQVFAEDDLRIFRPREIDLGCRCSHASISQMLLGLGRAEVESIIEDVGRVEVECGFCGATYRYDTADVESLFTASESAPPPTRH